MPNKEELWEDKSDALVEMSMFITKATTDGKTMRWQAVNSDTDPDSYTERMSLELYHDFINNILQELEVPEMFKSAVCSDFWCGGMPYLSVSHYPDLNGQAVPGEPLQLFIDGNRLKAKGVLYNSPLGHSVFRSLQDDKNKSSEDKIRISIGFLDLAHKHGEDGQLWVRESLTSLCPQCLDGVGEKVYVKGYLVHLALTRVPVNKRTEMVLEEKSMGKKITRKEDAASIVGVSLAEEIDAKNRVQAMKSDALVEMSEGEEKKEDAVAEVVEVEKSETAETNPVTTETTPGVVASTTDPRGYTEVAKSEPEPVEEKMMDNSYLPYGGATSMKEAQKAKETQQEMIHVLDMFGMFQNVAWNIIDRSDVTDKKAAFAKAVDEFKSMLAAKAMLEFSQATPVSPVGEMVEKSENQDHELKPALDALLTAIDNSVSIEGDINKKLQFVQPSLQELGTAITDYVSNKSVAVEPPAQNKDQSTLLEDIKELIQPLSQGLTELRTEVGVLKAQSNVNNVPVKTRIPQPRTLKAQPSVMQRAEVEKPKPGSIRDIVNKSVGIQE